MNQGQGRVNPHEMEESWWNSTPTYRSSSSAHKATVESPKRPTHAREPSFLDVFVGGGGGDGAQGQGKGKPVHKRESSFLDVFMGGDGNADAPNAGPARPSGGNADIDYGATMVTETGAESDSDDEGPASGGGKSANLESTGSFVGKFFHTEYGEGSHGSSQVRIAASHEDALGEEDVKKSPPRKVNKKLEALRQKKTDVDIREEKVKKAREANFVAGQRLVGTNSFRERMKWKSPA